jgi:hypothetical protein
VRKISVTRDLAFPQQATDEGGGNPLSGSGEEGLGEGWEGVDGFGGGFVRKGLRGADRTAVAGL